MKLNAALMLFVLLPFTAAVAAPGPPRPDPVKSPQSCKLLDDDVRHRKCPCTANSKKCAANGEYFRGDTVKAKCYTTGSTVDE